MSAAIERWLDSSLRLALGLARRAAASLPVVLVVAVIAFALVRAAAGDPAAVLAGDFADSAALRETRADMGLDQPLLHQFLVWSGHALQGNLGTSLFTRLPVSAMMAQRAGPTVALTLFTLLLAVPASLVLGAASARRPRGWLDRLGGLLSVAGFAVPAFVLGYVLVYAVALQLRWLPAQGYVPFDQGVGAALAALLLPSVTLAVPLVALFSRVTRNCLLDALAEPYVRTALAQGATPRVALWRHALPNAAGPILAVFGNSLAGLLGGAVVVEQMFNLPGIGSLLMDAVAKRDYPVIQGILLTLAMVYVGVNFIIDVAHGAIDPRVNS